jgi:MFS family permease
MRKLSDRFHFALLMAAAFLMDMALRGGGQAYQETGIALGASPFELGLLGTVFAFCYSVMCIIAGQRSDIIGRRASALIATAGVAAAYVLSGGVGQVKALFAVAALTGLSLAFFWPALQAWIGDLVGHEARALGRALSVFNVTWSMGIMLGPAAVGFLWAFGGGGHPSQRLVFYSLAVMAVLVAGLVAVIRARRSAPTRRADPAAGVDHIEPAVARLMLWAARVGLFAGYFAGGAVGSLFPKLGAELGYDERIRGLLVSSYHAGQMVLFALNLLMARWQQQRWPLALATASGCLALAWVVWARSPVHFGIAFFIGGLCSAAAYASSLFYSLHGRTEGHGRLAGIHEAVLSAGVFLAPLFGGIVAQHISLRAPFFLASAVFAAAFALQWVIWAGIRRQGRVD